jgi:hypothetical protein
LSEPVADRDTGTGMIGARIVFYQPFAIAIKILHLAFHLSGTNQTGTRYRQVRKVVHQVTVTTGVGQTPMKYTVFVSLRIQPYVDTLFLPAKLFLKECEFRFNYGTPKQQLKILREWADI